MRRRDETPAVARHQGGAFTRVQAQDEGWSPSAVDRRLSDGRWRRVCGKALTSLASPTAETLAWGARLTWPDAVTSHVTAGLLHRFPIPADGVSHVIVPGPRAAVRGIRSHQLALARGDVVQRERSVALTSRVRTAIDCLRTLPFDDALELYAWLVVREVLDRERLEEELRSAPGRWGNAQLAQLVGESEGGALSRAERRLLDLLRRAGITGWVANARIALAGDVAVVDVLFVAQKVVVEIDGYAAHSGRDAFVRDRRRQNALVADGYLVLRFTWADLTERPDAVLQTIAEALAGRSR